MRAAELADRVAAVARPLARAVGVAAVVGVVVGAVLWLALWDLLARGAEAWAVLAVVGVAVLVAPAVLGVTWVALRGLVDLPQVVRSLPDRGGRVLRGAGEAATGLRGPRRGGMARRVRALLALRRAVGSLRQVVEIGGTVRMLAAPATLLWAAGALAAVAVEVPLALLLGVAALLT